MFRVIACIRGAYATICFIFTELCRGAVSASVSGGDAPTSLDGTDWWSITAVVMVCGGTLAYSDGYGAAAPKYTGRGVYHGAGTAPDLDCFR